MFSLTRGWVCSLQLLLALTSAVILRSESHGTHDHILLSPIRDSRNLEGQIPVFNPTGTGWSSYTPRVTAVTVMYTYLTSKCHCVGRCYAIGEYTMQLVSRERIGKHVPVATNTHTTIELLLETMFHGKWL
jgi:hypothetical protein